MKKFLRIAAVFSAIAAISCAALPAYADSSLSSYEEEAENENFTGGWQVNSGAVAMSRNPEAKAAFKKATEGLVGMKYKAYAVLGTQVVAGTNYAILCRCEATVPDAQPEIRVMYIYADLQGNAKIIGFQTIIGSPLPGGFSANEGKLAIGSSKDVQKIYKKAMKGLTGVSYSPVAYLGSQVVAGTNYMILCRSRAVVPDAPYKWSLVTVGKDLEGKVSLVGIETLKLWKFDEEGTEEETDGNETVMIGNPWSEYSTVSEAAKAAGVEFSVPEKFGSHKRSYIQAMAGIVEVRYTKSGNTITVRKGKGSDDISGDYNNYKKVTEKEINGNTVTLKGNGNGIRAAVWTDGKCAYSVVSENPLSEKFMESIITGMC